MASVFRRILVPHDFSAPATEALRVAGRLASVHGSTVSLLHVIPPAMPVGTGAMGEAPLWMPSSDLLAREKQNLEKLGRQILGPGIKFDARVDIGIPLDRILNAAGNADCIVMATAGRTGLSHLVIGSVAEKVVRHSPIPVLTVRPSATATARASTERKSRGKKAKASRTPRPAVKATARAKKKPVKRRS